MKIAAAIRRFYAAVEWTDGRSARARSAGPAAPCNIRRARYPWKSFGNPGAVHIRIPWSPQRVLVDVRHFERKIGLAPARRRPFRPPEPPAGALILIFDMVKPAQMALPASVQ